MKEEIKSKISDKIYPNELVRDLMDINDMIQNRKTSCYKQKTINKNMFNFFNKKSFFRWFFIKKSFFRWFL